MEKFQQQLKEELYIQNGLEKHGKTKSQAHLKRRGMFNAMDRIENNLVEVRKLKNYKVPAITEKWKQLLKKRKSVGRKY